MYKIRRQNGEEIELWPATAQLFAALVAQATKLRVRPPSQAAALIAMLGGAAADAAICGSMERAWQISCLSEVLRENDVIEHARQLAILFTEGLPWQD